jgi:hypothetical protein
MIRAFLCFAAAVALWAAGLAGTYKGSYSGSAGASGAFTISLNQSVAGEWKAEVTFNLGEDIKAKITSVQVDGCKVKVVYEFDFQGTALESTSTGELKGDTFEGTYQTKSVADGSAVDEGTWKATRAE